MAGAAIPLMITGGALKTYSDYNQGQEASRMATKAANQMESNAKIMEANANRAKGVSQMRANETLRQARLLQSRQRALAAAGGGGVSSKNVSELIANTEAEGQLAASNARYEGDLRYDSLMNDAISMINKANATRYEGKQARKAGNIGAISSLLQTGGAVAESQNRASFYGKYGRAPMDYYDNNDPYYNSPGYGRRGTYDSYFQN